MNQYDEPRYPKPFEFISIPPVRKEDRQHPAGHDRYQPNTLSGQMTLRLVVITPLHIGTGSLRLTGDSRVPLVRATVRSNDRPIIPGSTLKGMIRSVVEAISHSCVRSTKARREELPNYAAGCQKENSLCVACRMFGSLGYLGNVRISDAVADKNTAPPQIVHMPTLHSPQQDTDVYYNKEHVKGRKFYKHGKTVLDAKVPVEILSRKSILDASVAFDNLSKAEFGLFLSAIGLGEQKFYLKVGGGKPACYGSLMLGVPEINVWSNPKDVYSSYDVSPAETYLAVESIAAAKELIVADNFRQLVKLLQFDVDRQCPDGNY